MEDLMKHLIAAVFALLFVSSTAFGQCYEQQTQQRYNTRPYTQTYHDVVHEVVHEVAAPIAIPVLVPSTVFQYLPALQPSAVAVGATPVTAAPVATATAAAPTAPQTMTAADIDRIVNERVEAAIRARLNGNEKAPPPLILPGEVLKSLEPKAEAQPPVQPAAQGDLTQAVANMLSSKSCVQCHTAGDQPVKGNVTLFTKKDTQLFFQPSVSKQVLLTAVTPDRSGAVAMPPSGSPLGANDVDLLRRWEAQK
jgi:hypothetical protein